MVAPPTVIVAVCTYKRNEPLTALLNALVANAATLSSRAAVGVVVVDDSSDGQAQGVVESFQGGFAGGIAYRRSGRQNISLARNLAIETALEMGDWVAMTDDDCEPVSNWLKALVDAQQRTGVDAVTGPMKRRVPPGTPKWLTEEPFLELGLIDPDDGAEVTTAATFNSMISAQWLRNHPDVRFQPDLGVVGGEDMVFYRAAVAAGLRIRYSKQALVYENEPPSRANLRYQLRCFFWHGNSSYIASVRSGVSPLRMFLHGGNSFRKAFARPVIRAVSGKRPQLRYCLAEICHALGKMAGPFGIGVHHR